jgi:hypothetical protein
MEDSDSFEETLRRQAL